ncbi:MAG: DinB family protein [Bryobacterales bacterium]|nr:DinB family protein [Bryobacterales bacterium]
MTAAERQEAVRLLEESLQRLASVTSSLSEEQARWKASPESWSVLDTVEHVTLVETAMVAGIRDALTMPASPETLEKTKGRDERLWRAVSRRAVKVQSPELYAPARRFARLREALTRCAEARRESIEFVTTTPHDLRAHAFPHFILGQMDAYQWVVFLAAHMERHIAQIEEILLAAPFPAAGPDLRSRATGVS